MNQESRPSTSPVLERCVVCGGTDLRQVPVLWRELIDDWQLSTLEAAYIDRQQGFHCVHCGANLRSMALAHALVAATGLRGPLREAMAKPPLRDLSILEINPAGSLTDTLALAACHRLVSFPDYDMTQLALDDAQFDLVVHSDTLEHVPVVAAGLRECRRVLRPGGRCVFTIPIVVGRLTRSRAGLKPSHHGAPGSSQTDLVVHTEFGADAWTTVLEAGFDRCTIHALEYPAGLAIEAVRAR